MKQSHRSKHAVQRIYPTTVSIGFSRRFYSQKHPEISRQLYYESPIDYDELGKRILQKELTSPLYLDSKNYRNDLHPFYRSYDVAIVESNAEGTDSSQTLGAQLSKDVPIDFTKRDTLTENDAGDLNFRNTISKEDRCFTHDKKLSNEVHTERTASFKFFTNKQTNEQLDFTEISIRKAVYNEILSRPWVVTYGDLPFLPIDLFAAEIGLQKDYHMSYIKLLWSKLSKAEKYAYEKTFNLTLAMKRKSKESVKTLAMRLDAFLFEKGLPCALHLGAFAQIQPTKWLVHMIFIQDLQRNVIPTKFKLMLETMLKHEKRKRAKAVNKLFLARLLQLKENQTFLNLRKV